MRRYWPILFFVLLPLIPLGTAVFGSQTIGAFDQIRQMAPWNGPKPAQPWDVLQADSVLQFYPWRDLVLSAWANGDRPYWNPYQLAGTPLLANSQSAGFYPLHILLGVLHVRAAVAIDLLAWFHLFWAGLGTYVLVRRFGGTKLGGLVAGGACALSPFMLGWTALPSVISTVSWIPWVMAFVAALFHRTDGRTALGLAACTAMMVLAGHLQFVAYGGMAAILLAVSLAVSLRKDVLKPLLGVGVGLAVGGLLAAPQLLPVLSYSQFSHRRVGPTEEGYAAYVASAVAPADFLARLANPFAQGDPTEYVSEEIPVSTFWPALAKPGANFAESASTLGPLILLLLCLLPLARLDWRRVGPLAIVPAFAALIAVGSPLNKLLYNFVPGWSATGSPARILSLFVLGACVLAGLALSEDLLKGDRKRIYAALGVFGVLLALTLRPTGSPAPNGINAEAWNSVVSTGNLTGMPSFLLATALAAIAVGAHLFGNDARMKWGLAAVAPLVALLALRGLIRTGDPAFLHDASKLTTGQFDRIATINDAWGLTTAAPAVLPPNTSTAMRVHDLAGYDSLLHRDTVELLRRVDGTDPAPPANGNIMFVKPSAVPAELADAGVLQTLGREGISPVPDSKGRVMLANGTARIVEEGLSFIKIDVVGRGRLVLKDRLMPGWSAQVDGKETPIEGTVWREVDVPAGARSVVMRYTPPGLQTGILAFVVGIAGAVGLALFGNRRSSISFVSEPDLSGEA